MHQPSRTQPESTAVYPALFYAMSSFTKLPSAKSVQAEIHDSIKRLFIAKEWKK